MADYANAIDSGSAIETWREARDDAELQSLGSGDTYTLTLESNTEDTTTCTFDSGDWAGVNLVIKSDVKYTKRFSYNRTAGSPSGDEIINWNQGGAGTLVMTDIIFDLELETGSFGHIRNGSIPSGQQLYERVGFARNLARVMNNVAANIVLLNIMLFDNGSSLFQPSGDGPKFLYMTSIGDTEQLMNVAPDTYDNETKNVACGSIDSDHNDIATDANNVATVTDGADIFTTFSINNVFDTTLFSSVTWSETNINNKTFGQIKNHTSVAKPNGMALVGVATTFAEPTDDFYGTVRDTANRDVGATAIAAAGASGAANQYHRRRI